MYQYIYKYRYISEPFVPSSRMGPALDSSAASA